MKEEKLVVLHFVGADRSGSTLLNIILDNHPNILGTGELKLFARNWINGGFCSCERQLRACPFWANVRDEWLTRTGMASVEVYQNLQATFERYRKLRRILIESRNPSQAFQEYSNYTKQLFEVIRDVSGTSVIADSSKHPARALALSAISEIDLRLIFLVRDARGYAWSKQKSFHRNPQAGLGMSITPMPVWKSTLLWNAINLVSELVLKKVSLFSLVRYEDVIRDTKRTLSEIGNLIDTDLSALAESVAGGEALEIKHIPAGNRLRMQKSTRLKNAESWQSEMLQKDRKTAWLLAGWLMKKYGYSKSET